MKKLIIGTIIITSFMACSQNKKQTMQNPNINAGNIVEEIVKQVKHYPSEKIYKIRHENDLCYYEILLNDIPVFRNYDNNVPDAFEINNSIFKSGKQTITYRMYPVGKNEEGNYSTLVDDTKLKLMVKSYDEKAATAKDVVYKEYDAPQIEEKGTGNYSKFKFAGAGKTYYEGKFDINIDVPYTLNPSFENAQDLRKINSKELEAKVLKEYQKIREIYVSKEKDEIAKLTYDRLKDDLVADYATEAKVKAAWNQLNDVIIKGEVDILPVKNYKMQFFANGKLVALYTDGTNPEIRGGNALVCKIKSGEFKNSIFEIKHFLYLPKGETEFKVY
ncbi:hypothetical protein [Chryseobacterium sp. ERMR1:04]|uniref:hypothetical protein n=1 Tax=Chryseobacterium sp. ERMR1:04 TaxID=1705393 RepID=UPI000AF04CE5|nr:hypothetical protein [Chryseobacterium sp. ERMR1:04]